MATLVEAGYASVGAAEIQVHDRILRVHAAGRRQKIDKGEGLDFATAEALAFGSLLREGHPIRISGQVLCMCVCVYVCVCVCVFICGSVGKWKGCGQRHVFATARCSGGSGEWPRGDSSELLDGQATKQQQQQ